ncbi:MAG TPA: hypothetical protein VIM79_16395, partial [Niastella sp.]
CYYWKGKLFNADNDPVLHALSFQSEISSVREDKFGNIFITDSKTINIITPRQEIKTIKTLDGYPLELALGGGVNKDSLFVVFTDVNTPARLSNLYVFDGSRFLLVEKRSLLNNSCNTGILSPAVVAFRQNDRLLFFLNNGHHFSVALPRSFINLSRIDDSLIAINTSGGAIIYNLYRQQAIGHFLKNQSVNDVIRDSEGDFWFMCAGNGLFKVRSLAFHHQSFRQKEYNLSVNSIQRINSFLHIGTEHSIVWKTDSSLQKVYAKKIEGPIVSRGTVRVILPANNNTLLIGTDGGLFRLQNFGKWKRIDEQAIKSLMAGRDFFLISGSQNVKLYNKSS